jgi:adenosylcobinamide-GDP ribazoletransferase
MSTWNGLITAARTLTVLRIPGKDAEEMAASLPWFPLVGLMQGLCVAAVGAAVLAIGSVAWSGAASLAMVVAGIALTGGLHLDGLADCADGIGAGRDRERALAIMKDSRTGVFGVLALACALLAKYVAYERAIDVTGLQGVVAAGILSRAVQVHLAVKQPYARATGTAAAYVRGANGRHLAWAAGSAGVLLAVTWGPGWWLAALWVVAWLVALGWGRWCRNRFGGVTGDVLGAGSELAEIAVLWAAGWL